MYEWPLHARVAESIPNGVEIIQVFFRNAMSVDWALLWELYDCVPQRQKQWWNNPNYHRDLNYKTKETPKALYFAARFGFPSTARSLIEQGVDVNSAGGTYEYPIIAASIMGWKDLVQLLLSCDVDVRVVVLCFTGLSLVAGGI